MLELYLLVKGCFVCSAARVHACMMRAGVHLPLHLPLPAQGVVERVIDRFVGEVCVGGGDVVRVDQEQLETVLPQPGGKVAVVNARYRGATAELLEIDEKGFKAKVKGRGVAMHSAGLYPYGHALTSCLRCLRLEMQFHGVGSVLGRWDEPPCSGMVQGTYSCRHLHACTRLLCVHNVCMGAGAALRWPRKERGAVVRIRRRLQAGQAMRMHVRHGRRIASRGGQCVALWLAWHHCVCHDWQGAGLSIPLA